MSRYRAPTAAELGPLRTEIANLHDVIALEEGSLAKLEYFQRKAYQRYRGRTCAIGHAVAEELMRMLREVAEDLPGTPVAALAAGLADGKPQVQIAAGLGMSPQHLTRRYKPTLLELLHRKLQLLDLERIAGPSIQIKL